MEKKISPKSFFPRLPRCDQEENFGNVCVYDKIEISCVYVPFGSSDVWFIGQIITSGSFIIFVADKMGKVGNEAKDI